MECSAARLWTNASRRAGTARSCWLGLGRGKDVARLKVSVFSTIRSSRNSSNPAARPSEPPGPRPSPSPSPALSFNRNEVHDAVLLGQAARPRTCRKIPERLRFSDADEWITHDRFDEVEHTQRDRSIGLEPKTEGPRETQADCTTYSLPPHNR